MSDQLYLSLQQYLSGRYPGSMITDFQFLTSGFESEVYTFTLGLPGQARNPLILRLFPGEGAGQKMAREAAGLAYLRQAGYPVPALLLSEPGAAVLGKPFILMEKLDGRALWPVLAGAGEDQATGLLNRFGGLFARLHTLDWTSFTRAAGRYQVNPALLLCEDFASTRKRCEQFNIPGFLPILDWLKEHQSQIRVRPAIVHLDFHANNVLLCSDERLVVIDWTQVSIADYRQDLSWTLMIMGQFGNPFWAEQIFQAYSRLASRPVENLDYFNVISYIKLLSSTVISLKASPTELGMRAETAAGIHQQAPVFRALLREVQKITGMSIPEVESALI